MRIRTIKPDFWSDGDVTQLTLPARLLFIGTWQLADDYGFLEDDAARMRNELFPGDRDIWADDVAGWLDELTNCGMLERVRSEDDRALLRIVHFRRHQKIDRPSRPRYRVALPVEPVAPAPEPRTRRGAARQAESRMPSDLPPDVAPYVEPVRAILADVAKANPGAEAPTLGAVARAMADFPGRDFLPVAREYRAWQVHGNPRTQHKRVVAGYRNQLDMAADVGKKESLTGASRPRETSEEKLRRAGL